VLAIVSDCLGQGDYQPPPLATYPILDGLQQYTSVDRNVSSLTRSELAYLFSALKPSIMLALHYERYDRSASLSSSSSLNDASSNPSQYTNRYSRWRSKNLPFAVDETDDIVVQEECRGVAMFLAQNSRCDDKVPLIEELAAAGVCPQVEFCDQLPTWQQVTELYGDNPVVLGLETCDAYRTLINGSSPMPKLTALWNSGSTALSKTFLNNMLLYDTRWTVDRATVTWGKVSPQEVFVRLLHSLGGTYKCRFLPVCSIPHFI
jgi:hypothetical protein